MCTALTSFPYRGGRNSQPATLWRSAPSSFSTTKGGGGWGEREDHYLTLITKSEREQRTRRHESSVCAQAEGSCCCRRPARRKAPPLPLRRTGGKKEGDSSRLCSATGGGGVPPRKACDCSDSTLALGKRGVRVRRRTAGPSTEEKGKGKASSGRRGLKRWWKVCSGARRSPLAKRRKGKRRAAEGKEKERGRGPACRSSAARKGEPMSTSHGRRKKSTASSGRFLEEGRKGSRALGRRERKGLRWEGTASVHLGFFEERTSHHARAESKEGEGDPRGGEPRLLLPCRRRKGVLLGEEGPIS